MSIGPARPIYNGERVPFGDRHGWRTHVDAWGRNAFSGRHTHTPDEDERPWSHCEPDQRFRCACPGTGASKRCCHRATAEDRLCDACRDWCWTIDELGEYHRMSEDVAHVAIPLNGG